MRSLDSGELEVVSWFMHSQFPLPAQLANESPNVVCLTLLFPTGRRCSWMGLTYPSISGMGPPGSDSRGAGAVFDFGYYFYYGFAWEHDGRRKTLSKM